MNLMGSSAPEPELRTRRSPQGGHHFFELGEFLLPVGFALLVLVEHFLRDLGGELFVGELGGDFLEFGFDFGDFFADAGTLGFDVDEAIEGKEEGA